MKLLATTIPTEGIQRSFRHPPGNDWFAAICVTLPIAGALWAAPRLLSDLPWWMLIVAAPIALLFGLILLVVAGAIWSAALSSRKPSNWLAKFMHEGVLLNLRSYKNAHFGVSEGTIAALPFTEIKSVGRLLERVETTFGNGGNDRKRVNDSAFIELTLRVSSEPIAAAVAAERNRSAPEARSKLGHSSTTKHHHYPVQVTGPNTVRIEWLDGLLEALAEQVELVEERRVDLTAELEGKSAEERAQAFVQRGHRFEAIRVGRDEKGLSKREAKAWVAELDGHRAA